MVVDDHAILRRGLGLLIDREDDLTVVAEAGAIDAALAELPLAAPDVVLVDINTPGGRGLEVVRRLRAAVPRLPVVVLDAHEDAEHVRRAWAGGATGYVVKSSPHEVLLAALRTVGRGDPFQDPCLPELGDPDALRGPIDILSPREREVLRLLALGYTNHQIADELVVSVKTVETHRAHIMNKLKVGSRAALVQYALAAGLLEPD